MHFAIVVDNPLDEKLKWNCQKYHEFILYLCIRTFVNVFACVLLVFLNSHVVCLRVYSLMSSKQVTFAIFRKVNDRLQI